MDVIFTVDSFVRTSFGGGLLRHVGYAPALARRGIRFRWLTLVSDADEDFLQRHQITVRVVEMPEGMPLQRKREELLREALKEAALLPAGQRIVTTDSCSASAGTIWQLWRARLGGLPTTHNSSMKPGPLPTSWAGLLRTRLVCRAFYSAHARVIPQTQALRRFYREFVRLPEPKMTVIGNGVDTGHFTPPTADEKRAARQRLGLAADAPVVVSVGSMVPRKGMDLLIQAWAQVLRAFPGARLAIAGSVGRRLTFMDKAATLDTYTEHTLALIQQLPAPESVVLSRREVEHVRDYYWAADLFVLASEREGLPNVVLEAMACGLPCLLSPYDGFPQDGEELGTAGKEFHLCAREPGALGAGIAALLADGEQREVTGAAAREWMVSTQNLETILSQWAHMYQQTAHGA
ncbi:MAG: glycosyltransferase family 4 protein [Prosthecobacter sp.]